MAALTSGAAQSCFFAAWMAIQFVSSGIEFLGILEEVISVPMITVPLLAPRTAEIRERFLNRPHIDLAKQQPYGRPFFSNILSPHHIPPC